MKEKIKELEKQISELYKRAAQEEKKADRYLIKANALRELQLLLTKGERNGKTRN